MAQCTAKSKRTQQRCTRPACKGMKVCFQHGGGTPKGIASPHFKHGKRSKYMPENLASKYQEAIADPDLGSLIRNIALNEAFVREKLEQLQEGGDSSEAWQLIAKAVHDLTVYVNNEDYGRVHITLEIMQQIIDDRQRYHMAVTEIQDTLAEQRKDLKVKADIELKEQNAVSVTNLMTFIAALVALINQVVPENDKRAQISEGIRRLIGFNASNQLLS